MGNRMQILSLQTLGEGSTSSQVELYEEVPDAANGAGLMLGGVFKVPGRCAQTLGIIAYLTNCVKIITLSQTECPVRCCWS